MISNYRFTFIFMIKHFSKFKIFFFKFLLNIMNKLDQEEIIGVFNVIFRSKSKGNYPIFSLKSIRKLLFKKIQE